MEIEEEFKELLAQLETLTEELNVKKLKENKEEIHAVLERMTELLDDLIIDEIGIESIDE
jgi:argininosuccinate lyase